jgi:hypothetical protein
MAPPIKMDPRLASLPGIRSGLESVRTPFDPKSVDPYRKGLAGLPGMDTKIYDDMVKQADSSAKLNFALALMQAGFGAAGASAKQGESKISTLSRTLLAPLSQAAGQVVGASNKEKMAARLGKLQAEGRISSTAYSAALADKTAGETFRNKLILQHLKPKTAVAPSITDVGPGFSINVGTKTNPKLQEVEARVFTPKGGGKPYVQLSSDVIGDDGEVLHGAGKKLSQGKGPGQYTFVDTSKGSSGASFNWIGLKEDLKDKNGKVIAKKDDKFQTVRHGSGELRIPALGGFLATSANSYSTNAPAVAKSFKPQKPEGRDSKLFKDLWKTVPSQIGSLEDRVDLADKKLTWKDGKFAFFKEDGEKEIFPDDGQKLFMKALEGRVYTAFSKFGGAEKVGDAESKNYLEIVVSDFFKTDPQILLDTYMKDKRREDVFPSTMRAVPTTKQLNETVAKRLTEAKTDNNIPVGDLLDGLRSNNANATKPVGRLLDMVGTNPLLFGSKTTGDVFNSQTNSSAEIGRRMLTEDVMKSLPANLTSPTKKVLRSATNRASVIQKAVNKKIEERNKKNNSPASQELRDKLTDSMRGVDIIDRYSKVAVESGAEGWITGSLRKALEKRGLQVLDPTTWGESRAQKNARAETMVLTEIMQQLNARVTLKQTGELRYSKADLEGAQAVWNKIQNSPNYNAAALREMRRYLMSNVKKQLGQTGSFAIDDGLIEQAIKLGVKPEDIKVAKSDKGFYNKYLPKPERKYNVTGTYAPGVSPERYKELEQLGVFGPFKTAGNRYMLYETEVTQGGVVQPVIVNGKMKTIFVREENLMSDNQQMRNNRAFSFNFFKNSLRR